MEVTLDTAGDVMGTGLTTSLGSPYAKKKHRHIQKHSKYMQNTLNANMLIFKKTKRNYVSSAKTFSGKTNS